MEENNSFQPSSNTVVMRIKHIASSSEPVSRNLLLKWMKSEDLEVLSAVWRYVLKPSYKGQQIYPPMQPSKIEKFAFDYFGKILSDQRKEFEEDQRMIIEDILDWFWNYERDDHTLVNLKHVKSGLYELCQLDNEMVRQTVIQSVISRLFEYQIWREFFVDMSNIPSLRSTHRKALHIGTRNSGECLINEMLRLVSSPCEIPLNLVREWMKSDNLDVLGAFWELILSTDTIINRITPELDECEIEDYYFHYYARCIKDDPLRKWGLTRYEAAHEIYGWFQDSLEGNEDFFLRTKSFLATLFIEGSLGVRDAIIEGALEHILEETRWREFFIDWRQHDILSIAWKRAMEWAEYHEK